MSKAHALVALSVILAPAVAFAAEGDPGVASRAALADELFMKGKAKMAEHRYDEACPMLAESLRLDPGGGTLLTLGLCHERQGKTATAWTELKQALERAEHDFETDRAKLAKLHVDALEPKLSRLAIRVDAATAETPGLMITRDGIALGRPAWQLEAPVDPGEHGVEVSAPGKRSWSVRVQVGAERALVRVDVPALADEPTAPAPSPPGSGRTVAAIALAGVGAVALGVGIGFGARALVLQSRANATCPMTQCSDPTALQNNASARTSAWVADVAIPLGVAAGVGSIVLFATAPRKVSGATAGAWRLGLAPGPRPFASVERSF